MNAYAYIGNGYCTTGPPGFVPSPTRVLVSMVMCPGDGAGESCVADVGFAQQCAAGCDALAESCTGFMVQDNSMYGAGVSNVCSLVVKTAPPPKSPRELFPLATWWSTNPATDWEITTDPAAPIGGCDTEKRDKCFKRVPECTSAMGPQCMPKAPTGAALWARAAHPPAAKFATPRGPCCFGPAEESGWFLVGALIWAVLLYLAVGAAYQAKQLQAEGLSWKVFTSGYLLRIPKVNPCC